MIGYIRGEILDRIDGCVLVGVGSGGMVGYQVFIPQSPFYSSFKPGQSIEFFIYTHVREDVLDLYGFCSHGEKELFLTLLSVTGIGPKGALGILSKIEPAHLIEAILEEDKDALIRIPGIGKKTAERVVLELAQPMRKKVEAGVFQKKKFSEPSKSLLQSDNVNQDEKVAESMFSFEKSSSNYAMLRDAKDALVGLGYREQEVMPLLKRSLEDKTPPKRVEDLIRTALQRLS